MTLRAKLTLGSVALATVLVTLISAVSLANLMQLKFHDQLVFTELIKQQATDAVLDSLNRQRTIDLTEAVHDPTLNQKLKDIMAQNVETVSPDATLQETAEKMKRRDIGVLPVVEAKKPIGVITDRDITLRAVAAGVDVTRTKVREFMTRELYFVYEDQTVNEACELMEKNKIRRLIVMNREGGIAGVLSLNDVTIKGKETKRSAEVLRKIAAA